MTIPVEMIIWVGGANMAVLTLCAHLLVSINTSLAQQDKRMSIVEYKLGLGNRSRNLQEEN